MQVDNFRFQLEPRSDSKSGVVHRQLSDTADTADQRFDCTMKFLKRSSLAEMWMGPLEDCLDLPQNGARDAALVGRALSILVLGTSRKPNRGPESWLTTKEREFFTGSEGVAAAIVSGDCVERPKLIALWSTGRVRRAFEAISHVTELCVIYRNGRFRYQLHRNEQKLHDLAPVTLDERDRVIQSGHPQSNTHVISTLCSAYKGLHLREVVRLNGRSIFAKLCLCFSGIHLKKGLDKLLYALRVALPYPKRPIPPEWRRQCGINCAHAEDRALSALPQVWQW